MRVLMTGGTGLIGRHFIRRFPQHQYVVISRDRQKAGRLLPECVEILTDLDGFNDLDEFDGVINLCGEPIADRRWSKTQKTRICLSRWDITHRLASLIMCSNQPPQVMLSGSAIGFYGDTGDEKVMEGDRVADKGFAHQVCKKWEDSALAAADRTRIVLLRTAVVLAAEGGALPRIQLPFRVGLGGKTGSGQQYMSWIHLDDQLDAMHFLLEHPTAEGPFNLSAPQSVTNLEFCQTLAEVMNTRLRLPVPAFVLTLMLGEAASLLLESQRVYPRGLLDLEFNFQHSYLKSALSQIMGAANTR